MESRKTRERKKKQKGEVSEEQKVTLPMVKMDRNMTSIFRYKFAYYVDYVRKYLCSVLRRTKIKDK